MRFGGLQKNSLIDYPGKISCVIFVSGCNFHCPFCHNPGLIPPSDVYKEAEIFDFLQKRKSFLDAVVVSGGEPTLQKDLPSFCRKIKSLGYSVKVDTNGSRPELLREVIESGLVDYLAMDLKADPDRYDPMISDAIRPGTIQESVRLILDSGIDHEFRTTCVKPFIDKSVLERLRDLIEGAQLYAIQQFRSDTVLNPEFFKTFPGRFGMQDLMTFRGIFEGHVKSCVIR